MSELRVEDLDPVSILHRVQDIEARVRALEAVKGVTTVVLACEECGDRFTPSDKRQRFCTPRCGNRSRYRRYLAKTVD